MAQYIGNSPSNILLQTKRRTFTYTATAGQTVFSGNDAFAETLIVPALAQVLVYVNGTLIEPHEYTTNAGSVTLNTAVNINDVVVIFTEIEAALVSSYTREETLALINAKLAALDTDYVPEGTNNLYYTDARVDANIALKTTDDISEGGANLYYTDTRVDTRFATNISSTSTDDISEGTTNLYYTDARVGTYLSTNGFDTASNIVASIVDTAPTTLDTLNELAAALNDDPNFASTVTTALGTKLNSADFSSTADTWLSVKTTTDLAEGTNLYYTDARVGTYLTANSYATEAYVTAAIQTKDNTDEITEGTTNLYFTDARADARIAAASVGDLSDVDITTTAPTSNQALIWDATNSKFVPGDSFSQADFDTAFGLKSLTDLNGISDGTIGQVLTTDGAGNFTFQDGATPTAVSGTAPISPEEGDLWFDNVTTGQLYTYVGTTWLSTAGLTTLEFSSVGDLSDVDITTTAPVTGQALIWDGTKFIPGDSFSQADFDTAFGLKTTTNLAEGTNLYYTDTRVGTYLTTNNYATTGDLPTSITDLGIVDGTSGQLLTTDGAGNFTFVNPPATYGDSDVGTYLSTNGYDTAANIVASIVDTAPATLDTLNELAAALGDDPNFATTITTSIGTKLNSADFNTTADTWLSGKSTTDISEGTNLYYTDARVGTYLTANSYATESYVTSALPTSLTDLSIVDGTAGQVLTTDGAGNFTFEDGATPTTVSGTAPTSPSEGDLWFDNVTTGQLYTYVGTAWLSTAGLTTLEFSSVGDLSDVDITSAAPVTGQSLVWDGTKFIPGDSFSQTDFDTAFGLKTTTNLAEGTNLYFTTARVDTEIDSYVTGGTGVTVSAGEISIGQDVGTNANVDFHNLTLSGNLTVNGTTTTVNTTNLAVSDNMIYLADGNTTTNIDIGFAGNYNDGAYAHAGLFRDASDGRWKFFDSYTLEPDAAVDIDTTHASFNLAPLQAGSFIGDLTGNVTGTVSSLSNHSTTDLAEGTNLYYTDARVGTYLTTNAYATESYVNTAISTASSNYATAAQGALADSALQTVAFADLTSTPTTLAGYGITDAFDGQYSSLTVTPTTLAGYGITDAFDGQYSSLTGTPTTLAGYGITDAFDGAYSSLTGAPTIPSAITDLGIVDGTSGQVLSTDGAGNFSFIDSTGASVVVSGTAPVGAVEGDLWFDNVTTGELFVYESGAWLSTAVPVGIASINDIDDVDTTSTAPLDGQALVWDATNSKWIPGDSFSQADFDTAFGLKSLTDLNGITDGTTGQLLSTDGAGNFTFISPPATYGDSDVATYLSTNGFDTAANIVASIVDTAPTTLDTLNELAAALGDDPNFATTVTTSLGLKANSADLAAVATSGLYSDLNGAYADADAIAAVTGSDLDMGANKILYSNVYAAELDLPTAANYHGMFAHVHATGRGYFAHAGSWIALANQSELAAKADTSSLATVATTGAYSDLIGTPNISAVGYSNSYTDLDNLPTLSTVAGTGDYNDLLNTPVVPASINDLTDVDTTTSAPADGQALVWSSTTSKWRPYTIAGGTGGSSLIPTQDTAPIGPADGQLWFDTESGTLFVYYDDGSTAQWIQVANPSSGGTIQSWINDLADVDTTTTLPLDGQALIWDNASSKWIPGDTASSIATLTDVDLVTTPIEDGQTLVWDAVNSKFIPGAGGGGGGASITTSETAPELPLVGDMWFNSATLSLFLYYDDGDSLQWIQINDAGGAAGNGLAIISSVPPENPAIGDLWYDDASTGTLLIYNGEVWVSTADGGGAGNQTGYWSEVATPTFDAINGSKLFIDTTLNSVQVNLPANPSMGDEVYIVDATGTAGTNNIIVYPDGNNITGLSENLIIDVDNAAILLAYYNATRGWIVLSK